MLGAVAIFSFLLPPESGERISLCLTTLLGIAVYAMVVADNVPESSREVPLISECIISICNYDLLITHLYLVPSEMML